MILGVRCQRKRIVDMIMLCRAFETSSWNGRSKVVASNIVSVVGSANSPSVRDCYGITYGFVTVKAFRYIESQMGTRRSI